MIRVQIVDGLGNQMFQYAYARMLQHYYKEPIIINTKKLEMSGEREFGLSHFKLNKNVHISKGMIKEIDYIKMSQMYKHFERKNIDSENTCNLFYEFYEKGYSMTYGPTTFEYYPFQHVKRSNKYVIGYFQAAQYLTPIEEHIKRELQIKTPPSQANREMLKSIRSDEAVCVHIRRGDYLKRSQKCLNLCNEDYYLKAMKYIAEHTEHPVFYIFSNSHKDLKYIKENYHFEYEVKYVDLENAAYEELRLMTACRHFIISNSTFSWWAQYLSGSLHKIVMAPSQWIELEGAKSSNLYLENWKIVNVANS